MKDPRRRSKNAALDDVIALAEAALSECDEHGYVYAAIDLSAAVDKLKALKASSDLDG
jgi:hypothetical protein